MRKLPACRLLALAALVACAGFGRAAAQEPGRVERARAGLPRAAASRLDQIVSQAAARGLPTAPLIDKTLEGEAKKAAPERILIVVQQLAANLGRAQDLLADGRPPAPEDVTAAADALRRGVSERAIHALHDGRAFPGFALPVETLADLHEIGVPDDQALAVLQAWAARRGKDIDLRDLPAAVERLIHSGRLPAQAAQSIAQGMTDDHARRGDGDRGKSDVAPGRGKSDRPPVSPGAGPPRGRDKPSTSNPGHRGHG